MRFIFRRDEEGTERIYIGDVCVVLLDGPDTWTLRAGPPAGVTDRHITDAIERACDAGFWARRIPLNPFCGPFFTNNKVVVEVPVAETSTTLTLTLDGDES